LFRNRFKQNEVKQRIRYGTSRYKNFRWRRVIDASTAMAQDYTPSDYEYASKNTHKTSETN
jgi:hypothetical protein